MSYSEKVRLAYSKSPDRSGRAPSRMRRRMPQRAIYLVASVILIAFFYLLHRSPAAAGTSDRSKWSSPTPAARIPPKKPSAADRGGEPPCRSLPGSEDVLVIMKTGSTEIQDKLPIHFNTTLKCYPQYMLFSDYEEEFMGHHIYDALEFASPKVKESNADFELWRRLQKGGRAALKPQELSGPMSRPQSNNGGKPSNPGWKLDKWKFLPMVNMTYHAHPDKKWYMFVETDTYVMWQSVLNYMKALDETKPYYLGGQAWIGDVQFNHGGTGFIVSNPAMKNVVKMFQDRQTEWEEFTDHHWAGDCVLGKAMKDSGSPPLGTWPFWQGDDPGHVTWWREDGPDKRLWCAPAVSYHHVGPNVIEELWEFEQEYISKSNNPTKFLRQYDMFRDYVLPQVTKSKTNWDNHADEDRGPVDSLEACSAICEADKECVQYALTTDLRCSTTNHPNMGEWSKGIESGWFPERMEKWASDRKTCSGHDWMT